MEKDLSKSYSTNKFDISIMILCSHVPKMCFDQQTPTLNLF